MLEYETGFTFDRNKYKTGMNILHGGGIGLLPESDENIFVSSVRSSNSHPDLLLTHHQQHPLFQITPVLNTGLSLSEPLQLYKGYNAI